MKKYVFLCFFIFTASYASAGSISLTTYYPPPMGAYNQVKLATNYAPAGTTAAIYCTGSNNGSLFTDNTGALNVCTGTGAANPYCTAANNGVLVADSKGTLHVCVNSGHSSVYPQQCYNIFCSYDSSVAGATCTPTCPQGFSTAPVDGAGHTSESFQESTNTWLVSVVCCSL